MYCMCFAKLQIIFEKKLLKIIILSHNLRKTIYKILQSFKTFYKVNHANKIDLQC